ncbi:MAG: xpsE 1 [Gemmataceae bacterium]|nr:xpsE 1 [Gemmataceae bacterium]
MSSHPDADAFMRRYLRKPPDVTTRLVFADWLEETGTPSNVAWAHYIRAKAGAEGHPVETGEGLALEAEAAAHAAEIRANLTVPVALFLGYPKSLLQLLPGSNITVRLAGYEIPPAVIELVPESVARENVVLPLQVQMRTLVVATADPGNTDTTEKLDFILNKNIVPVRALADDIQDVIDQRYGQTEVETVDSIFVEYPDTPVPRWFGPPDENVVDRVVHFVVREAIGMGGQRVQFHPRPDQLSVRYRVQGTWVTRDALPRRLLSLLRDRLARLAGPGVDLTRSSGGGEFRFNYYGTVYTIRVAIDTRDDDPVIDLDIADEIEIAR